MLKYLVNIRGFNKFVSKQASGYATLLIHAMPKGSGAMPHPSPLPPNPENFEITIVEEKRQLVVSSHD